MLSFVVFNLQLCLRYGVRELTAREASLIYFLIFIYAYVLFRANCARRANSLSGYVTFR